MHYYGYEWEKQVSILASRITLHLQKEVELRFCSTAEVRQPGEKDSEYIYGFTLPQRFDIEKSVLADMVKDLYCIHINKRYWDYENAFVVCREPWVLQEWYDMHYQGTIATEFLNKLREMAKDAGHGSSRSALNKFDRTLTEGEYESIRNEVEQDMLAEGFLVRLLVVENPVEGIDYVVTTKEVCNE
tara:strand:+ start:233 stop:793 length:561 start_codon:yes stop_codon:yes gene_type:complete